MARPLFIVGLGNPGAQYEWTRHNCGFLLVDYIARRFGAQVKRQECRSLVGRIEIAGVPVQLVKPQTYMNLSGEAVACLVGKYEIRVAEELVVVSDDIALPFGTIRLRRRGSAGGQKGLQSIIAALGSEDFMRLRIGIGPDHPVSDTAAFVLDRFPQSARDELEKILERSAAALQAVIEDGIDKAMAQYNQ